MFKTLTNLALLLSLGLTQSLKAQEAHKATATPRRPAAARKERAPQRPINLNAAGVTELMQLPRIGAKTAERIVAFRKQNGGFMRTEELMNVKGIGEKSFAKLKPHVMVGASTKAPSAAPSQALASAKKK
jgi:competence protein ComEA